MARRQRPSVKRIRRERLERERKQLQELARQHQRKLRSYFPQAFAQGYATAARAATFPIDLRGAAPGLLTDEEYIAWECGFQCYQGRHG